MPKDDMALKSDHKKLSEKKYHEILAERNSLMNKCAGKAKTTKTRFVLPDGYEKTKYVDRVEYKTKDGRNLGSKTYLRGVHKKGPGINRFISGKGID